MKPEKALDAIADAVLAEQPYSVPLTSLHVAPAHPQAAIERLYEITQHVGWLKIYVATMDKTNWRDMRDSCERQLDELSSALTRANP